MSRASLTLLVAGIVASLSPSAAAHDRPVAHRHGPAESKGTVFASVEADASGVAEAGASMQKRIVERAGLVMHESGILPARGRDDATVRVEVDDLEGRVVGYSYDVWVERSGAVVGERRRESCVACSETELLDAVVGAVEHALAGIEAQPAAAPTEPTATESEPLEDSAREPTVDATTDAGPRALGPKGKAGIGLLVGGGAVLVTGIGLAIPQPKPLDDDPLQQRSLRPPGFALIGIGAAAAVTGAVLLALDRKRATTTAWAPTIGPGMTGVGVSGRF